MRDTDPFSAPAASRTTEVQLDEAAWWRRVLARGVDAAGLALVLFAWLQWMQLGGVEDWRGVPHLVDLLRFAAPSAAISVVILGLHIGLLVARGHTVGQWLLAIRVVQSRGGMPDALRLMAREGSLWGLVLLGPPGWLTLALDVVLGVLSGRSLRDRATGTRCVGDG